MSYTRDIEDRIVMKVQAELSDRYKGSEYRESVTSMKEYKSLPITTPANDDEVSLILKDVVLVSKLKKLDNGEVIPVYELFGENGVKILETNDDGRMEFEREVFDDLIKNTISKVKAAGKNLASISLDGNRKIDSFFEMINGKVIAINKEQKARLDKGANKKALREDLDGETADPEIETSEAREKEQDIQEREQNEQVIAEQVKQDLGFTIHQMTKVDDPVFRMNNPQTRGKDLYVALTHNDEVKFITMDGGTPKEAEGFQNSGNASGRTTKILNDDDLLADNEVNTYGEIYPTGHNNMRYTVEKGQYGEIKLVEQIRYDGSKMSETDAWISREVESDNTNYLDKNREGAENSDNITARAFNQASQNTNANYYGNEDGKGGLKEVGEAMKEKPTNTNMESMASDPNNRYDAAKKMVVDAAEKQGLSFDPDSDPDTKEMLDKRVKDIIDNSNGPFTEDTADAVLMEIQMEQRAKASEQQAQEEQDAQDKETEEGRNRLEEEHQRRMNRR